MTERPGGEMDKEDMNKEAHGTHRLAITSVPHNVWQLLGDYATDNAFTSRSAAARFLLNKGLESYSLGEKSDISQEQ